MCGQYAYLYVYIMFDTVWPTIPWTFEHVQTIAEIHLSVGASECSTFWKQVDELAHVWMQACKCKRAQTCQLPALYKLLKRRGMKCMHDCVHTNTVFGVWLDDNSRCADVGHLFKEFRGKPVHLLCVLLCAVRAHSCRLVGAAVHIKI